MGPAYDEQPVTMNNIFFSRKQHFQLTSVLVFIISRLLPTAREGNVFVCPRGLGGWVDLPPRQTQGVVQTSLRRPEGGGGGWASTAEGR